MSPRERVLAALRHREPDRVPFSWGLGVTREMSARMREVCAADGYSFDALRRATEELPTIAPRYAGPHLPERTDIWGIRRAAVSYAGGEYDEIEYYPLAAAESPADLDAHTFPNPDWFDFSGMRAELERRDPEHHRAWRAAIGVSGNILEQYTWMTGLEQTLVNLLVNPELVHAALDRVTAYFEAMAERAVEAVGDWIDVFYFADDLGGQSTLLMSRETYREMIQPYHRRAIAHAKSILPGSRAMFHTDGAVFDIVPDLLDAGVDILEAVQTDADGMDPSRLKSAYGEKLSFHGGIPVQSLLPHGTVDEVRRGCRRLVSIFGSGGGYIAAPTHAVQVGTPPRNLFAMLETVLGEGDLARAVETARRAST